MLGGTTLTQTVTVKPDPRDDLTQADYQSAYDFAEKYTIVYGKIDEVLNNLDAIKKSLAAAKPSDAGLQADVAKAKSQWDDIFSSFTADFHNDEDQIQRPGSLREEVPRTGFGASQPPTAEQLDYASRFDAAYNAAIAKYNDYATSLQALSKRLQASGGKPIDGTKNATP